MAKKKRERTPTEEFRQRMEQGDLFTEESQHFERGRDGNWREAVVADSLQAARDLLQDVDLDSNAYEGPVDAPWSPVETGLATKYLREHPDARLTLLWPSAWEEDRTKKLQDLALAETLGAISHQRMSEQMATELNFQDDYSYDDEMETIAQERPPQPAITPPDNVDPTVARMLGPLMGRTAPDAEPRRQPVADMRDDSREVKRWKSECATALRELERVRTELRTLRETVKPT